MSASTSQNRPRKSPLIRFAVAIALLGTSLVAQMPLPYGAPITLDQAKKSADAALAEAAKNKWNMVVAIVNADGDLIYFEKMDNAQSGSINVAIDKARSAALFKRPTKAWQDVLAAGGAGLRILKLQGVIPVEGGNPLVAGGKIIGAIGVSGDSSEHDNQCSMAGAGEIK